MLRVLLAIYTTALFYRHISKERRRIVRSLFLFKRIFEQVFYF